VRVAQKLHYQTDLKHYFHWIFAWCFLLVLGSSRNFLETWRHSICFKADFFLVFGYSTHGKFVSTNNSYHFSWYLCITRTWSHGSHYLCLASFSI
jgi:hypothetical protein